MQVPLVSIFQYLIINMFHIILTQFTTQIVIQYFLINVIRILRGPLNNKKINIFHRRNIHEQIKFGSAFYKSVQKYYSLSPV
jgi:hypothetical protein